MNNTFYVGLDLGQASDYSALAILEKQEGRADVAEYHCRHLQRWPLKTSYPAIVADVARMVGSDKLQPEPRPGPVRVTGGRPVGAPASLPPVLAVDATGVGAPVVDLLKREKMPAQLEPIQITGGDSVTRDGGVTRVPKRDLVSVAQVAFQSGRLKIPRTLPEAATLLRELQSFQVKISLDTAHDSYGAWREGSHDDLVLALCLALWIAHHGFNRDVHLPGSRSYSGVGVNWKLGVDWRG